MKTTRIPRVRSMLTLAQASYLAKHSASPFSESEGAANLSAPSKALPVIGQIITVTMDHGTCPVSSAGRVEHVSEHGFRVKGVGSFLMCDVESGLVAWEEIPRKNEELERLCDLAFFGYDDTKAGARIELKKRLMDGAAIVAELLEFAERYVMEMGFKAERNGGTLTGAEWYDLKRAKDAIAKATGVAVQ